MMFDPGDVDRIATMSIQLLQDPAAREENVRLGAENARRFSWRTSAEQMVQIYQALGGTG
jgi:glycosyltransferase involved in cell wall biosynthesis